MRRARCALLTCLWFATAPLVFAQSTGCSGSHRYDAAARASVESMLKTAGKGDYASFALGDPSGESPTAAHGDVLETSRGPRTVKAAQFSWLDFRPVGAPGEGIAVAFDRCSGLAVGFQYNVTIMDQSTPVRLPITIHAQPQ